MRLSKGAWRVIRIIDPIGDALVFVGLLAATVGYIYGGIWVLAAIW